MKGEDLKTILDDLRKADSHDIACIDRIAHLFNHESSGGENPWDEWLEPLECLRKSARNKRGAASLRNGITAQKIIEKHFPPREDSGTKRGTIYDPDKRTVKCDGVETSFYCGMEANDVAQILFKLNFKRISLQDSYIELMNIYAKV